MRIKFDQFLAFWRHPALLFLCKRKRTGYSMSHLRPFFPADQKKRQDAKSRIKIFASLRLRVFALKKWPPTEPRSCKVAQANRIFNVSITPLSSSGPERNAKTQGRQDAKIRIKICVFVSCVEKMVHERSRELVKLRPI